MRRLSNFLRIIAYDCLYMFLLASCYYKLRWFHYLIETIDDHIAKIKGYEPMLRCSYYLGIWLPIPFILIAFCIFWFKFFRMVRPVVAAFVLTAMISLSCSYALLRLNSWLMVSLEMKEPVYVIWVSLEPMPDAYHDIQETSNQALQRTRTASAPRSWTPTGSTTLPASAEGKR
jgi:hypothetical protein